MGIAGEQKGDVLSGPPQEPIRREPERSGTSALNRRTPIGAAKRDAVETRLNVPGTRVFRTEVGNPAGTTNCRSVTRIGSSIFVIVESRVGRSYIWMGMHPLLARPLGLVLVLLAERASAAQSATEDNPSPAPTTEAPSEAAPQAGPAPSSTTPTFSPPPARGFTSSSVSLATPASPPPLQTPRTAPAYVTPFQLRSASPRTGVRLDTIVAPYRYGGESALETVLFLSGQIRLHQHFFLQARWGFDDNRVGTGERNRTGFVNPSLGFILAFPVGPLFRFAASTSIGLPLATGGGNGTDADGLLLQRQAALARSAMDNNAFSPNDLGVPTGLSLAFVHRGLTAQVDGTIIASGRVKGTGAEGDGAKVNSTFGFFMGYLVVPEVSLGAELRYQYYLLPPSLVDQDPSARDNLTVGAGGRLEIELSDSARMRPGVCLSTGVAGYVEQQSFRMVQFDVPISF